MVDRENFARPVPLTRHEQLSTSTANAATLVSTGQSTFEVTTLADTIDASDGLLSLREAIIEANGAAGADTITFVDSLRGGTIELASELPTITDDVTLDGDASDRGAGSITVDGAIVLDNNFNFVSGAYTVLQARGAAVGLEDLTITGGETGIEAEGSNLQLARVAVDDNTQAGVLGGAGIGIDLTDASLDLTDSSVSGNAGEGGAGILFENSDVEVNGSTIADNGGGFIVGHGIVGSGNLSVSDSTLANNGGYFGISVEGALTLINSTLYGNGDALNAVYDPSGSGALEIVGNGLIRNSTITGNYGSAIVAGNLTTTVDLQNSIIDGAIDGTVGSNGANVFTAATVDGAVAGDVIGAATTDFFATGALADNGGPTQTVALLDSAANPALNAADPADAPATDQRGYLRDATPDIGSFELNGVPALVVTTLDDVVDASDGLLSLREAIAQANTQAGADTITFAENIRGGTIRLTEGTLTITDDLIIDGDPLDGGSSGMTIDGGVNSSPTYTFSATVPLAFEGVTGRVEDLTITDGYAYGIRSTASDLTVARTDIQGTASYVQASGIHASGGRLVVSDSTIGSPGLSEPSVGIGVNEAEVIVTDSRISGNEYGILGSGQVTIDRSLIVDNFLSYGSGVSLRGTLTINDSLFAGNGTYDGLSGNAIEIDGNLRLVNSTITQTATGESTFKAGGGAIVVTDGSQASLESVTLTGTGIGFDDRTSGGYRAPYSSRYGDSGPGLQIEQGAQVSVRNSIIDDRVVGSIVSGGNNTFRETEVTGATASDQLGVTADSLFAETAALEGQTAIRFGLLADNGGPTQTVALLDSATNPALNAADPDTAPATDQRGFPRDATPDIGAFEVSNELVVTTLDDVVDATDGVLSLREAVEQANTQAGFDTITFADSIRGGTILMTQGRFKITDELTIDGDQLDRGAAGIVIDGNRGDSTSDPEGNYTDYASYSGFMPFDVTDTYARFEDLTIRDAYAPAIFGTDAEIHVARSAVESTRAGIGYGILVRDSTLVVSDSLIAGNAGESGGGIRSIDGDLLVTGSTISGNGGDAGYGIYASGTARIAESSILDNSFAHFGGGVRVDGSLEIVDSTLARNGTKFGEFGSAIQIDGKLVMVNSTVADNRLGDTPGVIHAVIDVASGSTAQLTNITLTGSPAYGSPPYGAVSPIGLYVGGGAAVTIANSIIDHAVSGSITSNGANTFGDAAVDGATATDRLGVTAKELFAETAEIGMSGVYAGLLADNGGPTQTVALLDSATNPALNAADPTDAPAMDQRGLPRDATPDIGAFELEVQPPPDTLPPLAEKVPLPDSEIKGAPLFLVGPSGDAEIAFADEVAAFQSSLGVYLVGPDGTIGATSWAFARIEHAEASSDASAKARPGGGPLEPGDAVQLSDLFDPADLAPGTGFGLFLVADGWTLNDAAVFQGGSLEFRSDGGAATVTDSVPDLVHIAAGGGETLVLGNILHTIDAGSANPLSNSLNPGGTGQVTSGLHDGAFIVAFEDKPLGGGSDRDFNDALFTIEPLVTTEPIVTA